MSAKGRRRHWHTSFLAVLALAVALCAAPPGAATAQPELSASHEQGAATRQEAFAAAAREFGVPEPVLLAVAYNLSRWEDHQGAPSAAAGYGPMHLIGRSARPSLGQRGDDLPRAARVSQPGFTTLEDAAKLLGLDPAVLKGDPAQNIRGGAALLARHARDTLQAPSPKPADWYGAVARYSGTADARQALDFADSVYATIRQGASRTTSDGQRVALAAQNVQPNTSTARGLLLQSPPAMRAECPDGLPCAFAAAAHQLNTADPTDYGNYDFAARPDDGLDVRYIVIHNTEIDYNLTLRVFQNPANFVSTHYLVRSTDGQVAQLVRAKNVAWHAGNWYFNAHAIGIEHEGVAIQGATWYTEPMYRASARLVRYLAARYRIPLDRAHIIGHDEIPGPTPAAQAGMHWDPGPFWDWEHYMELLGSPLRTTADNGQSPIVTIAPRFADNQPQLTYCYRDEATECRDVPSQAANFVYLHAAPSFDAPLVANSYIESAPTHANNWANKAVAGQQFYRVARQGDWDAIYYGGQVAWLHNPGYANTAPARGLAVTPRVGLASIPVYGRAYPEHAAYPTGVVTQTLVPIYEMQAGQVYVATDLVGGSYYWAPTYASTPEAARYTAVRGETQYYQIYFNHRFGFVRARDVALIANRSAR